jgi:hypothetical protein
MKNRRGSIENVALEVGEQFPNSRGAPTHERHVRRIWSEYRAVLLALDRLSLIADNNKRPFCP